VLTQLVALTAAGALRPVISRTVPFAAADEALAEVAEGHVTGKIVVLAD
jgi:NADPH:quinone reductase-like Zn-dependent oxidoreductase